jgi:hypothetical protein
MKITIGVGVFGEYGSTKILQGTGKLELEARLTAVIHERLQQFYELRKIVTILNEHWDSPAYAHLNTPATVMIPGVPENANDLFFYLEEAIKTLASGQEMTWQLRVWVCDGETWVIAENEQTATEVMCEQLGEKVSDYADTEWVVVSPTKEITVIGEDDFATTLTAEKWIEKNGRGYLCSSNY